MKPSLPPLTHHEILGWVGPFTRCGRHVDLAASDRLARRLVFRPIVHEPSAAGSLCLPSLRDAFELDASDPDRFRLTRVLTPATGPVARLQTEGPDPGELLARLQAIPLARAFSAAPGVLIARSLSLEPLAPPRKMQPREVLRRGVADVGGFTLTLEPPVLRGMRAELVLTAPEGARPALPDDVFEVLGRDWSRLDERAGGWRSSVRLRGGAAARSRNAEARLAEAASHLALTLAEPPARFHERRRAARWRVWARRAVPLSTCILLVVGAACVPKLGLAENSPWRMLIFNAPPLLLILAFCLHELPRIEIPPRPRRAGAASWWPPAPVASAKGAPTGVAETAHLTPTTESRCSPTR